MLAPNTQDGIIRTSEGDVVSMMTITIEGTTLAVLPVPVVAERMGYTHRYINLLCSMGILIAFKVNGRWLVSACAVLRYPDRDSLDCPDPLSCL